MEGWAVRSGLPCKTPMDGGGVPKNVVPLHRNQQTSTQIQIAHGQNYFCPASKPKLPMVKTEIDPAPVFKVYNKLPSF